MSPGFDRIDIDELFDGIQAANDQYRRSLRYGVSEILWSPTIARRGSEFLETVLTQIREQEDFDDRDTLHDYGLVVVNGEQFAWTILYFDADGLPVSAQSATERGLSIESA